MKTTADTAYRGAGSELLEYCMLDQVKDDPEALERRQRFLAAIDAGDPAALERWRSMRERRQNGERSRSEK